MNEAFWKKKTGRNWQFAALVGLTIGAILLSLLNARQMERNTQRSIQAYGNEVTAMIAAGMHSDMESRRTSLRSLADSVAQLTGNGGLVEYDAEALEGFLLRKAGILDLDALLLYDTQGNCVAEAHRTDFGRDAEAWFASEEVRQALRANSGIGVLSGARPQDQKIFYVNPVSSDGKDVGVLIGVFAQASLQKSMDDSAYKGRTLSCIVDRTGSPVVIPSQTSPFLYLDTIYLRGELEGIEDLLRGDAGKSIFFESADGKEHLLTVDPLAINGWRLLSIVPVDLLLEGNSLYIRNFFMILVTLLVLFLVLIQVIYLLTRRGYRQMYELTYQDSLTGGWNGEAFRQQYRAFLQERQALHHSVVMLNVRDFKLVNERLDFAAGDEILKAIYQCVSRALSEERLEFVCRSETDHFFICLDERDPDVVQERVDGMIADIREELLRRDIHYPLTVLAGCCIHADPDWDVQLVKERARIAERHNRPEYGKCLFWNDEIVARHEREAALEYSFEAGLERREFEVCLQPKVDLKTGGPMGAEALITWNHPEFGRVSPGEFIPLLERSDRIHRLDFYVFQEVCRFYSRRVTAGLPWYPVSVNLSRHNFYSPERLEAFFREAEFWQIPPGTLEIEITESIFSDEQMVKGLKRDIERIRARGFLCSMDDFGAGYSSLGILREFDVDTIKLDRSFFLDISDQKARDIIQSVVELAKLLKIKTVAEGVEEKATVDFLTSIGCTAIQGFYFSRPLPVSAYERWLAEHEAASHDGAEEDGM